MRQQGKSYSQIKSIVGVSKSTLSLWLRDYPLAEWRIRELRDHNQQRIEQFRKTMMSKKSSRLNTVYEKQSKLILPLTKRDLLVAGLFLYWGEGEKAREAQIGISNTDPAVPRFFIYWLMRCFGVPKEKLRVRLQLYSDMSIIEKTKYWSETLNIPLFQFQKPYVKKNLSSGINYKGGFGHGTCNILVGDVRLYEKILMSLKCIRDFINNKGRIA